MSYHWTKRGAVKHARKLGVSKKRMHRAVEKVNRGRFRKKWAHDT